MSSNCVQKGWFVVTNVSKDFLFAKCKTELQQIFTFENPEPFLLHKMTPMINQLSKLSLINSLSVVILINRLLVSSPQYIHGFVSSRKQFLYAVCIFLCRYLSISVNAHEGCI